MTTSELVVFLSKRLSLKVMKQLAKAVSDHTVLLFEKLDDEIDLREAMNRLNDKRVKKTIPWEEVKKKLK